MIGRKSKLSGNMVSCRGYCTTRTSALKSPSVSIRPKSVSENLWSFSESMWSVSENGYGTFSDSILLKSIPDHNSCRADNDPM